MTRQWQASVLAVAAATLFSLPATDAHALALGRVTVQSALGEPLRADIEVPEINADEASSLRVSIAAPQMFRAAGMEYSQALATAQITLERRPDGRYFLRLQSDRPINEPFVDIILETAWSSGRIVRDFTMLFDPPTARQPQAPLMAQAAPAPAAPTPAPAPQAAPVAQTQQPRPRAGGAPVIRVPGAAPAQPSAPGQGKQVTVQAGDTASKIAGANKPGTVSLDQMLVAMLRSNPDAFIGGNINRLRAGAVLNLPSQEQAEAVTPGDASQTLVAQSRDFNEFRRRLAEGLPAAQATAPQRQASGRVQAQVEEKKPAASSPDKLTLSKGSVQGRAGTEDRIASARASKDNASRVAELNRNLNDLKGLAAASAPLAAGAASGAAKAASGAARPASGPGPTVPAAIAAAPAPAAAPAASVAATSASAARPAAAAAAPASAPAATAAAPASAPAAAVSAASAPTAGASAPSSAAGASAPIAAAPAAPKKPSVPPPPPPEPSLVDELLENPVVPAGIGAVLLGLLGFGIWKVRQRRKGAQVDSSFLESRLQPDSFFGASGGQRVDTAEGTPTGSSMVYSPSQLDAAGDVDPVAEADVYLAYGRDLQAEEILKEALRTNPQRVAIHSKLLEIYAKRKDDKQFEQVASQAYQVTGGQGAEWSRICELGQTLDPANPLYQPGGAPAVGAQSPALQSTVATPAYDSMATVKQAAIPEAPAAAASVDLDLDFSLDDPEPAAAFSAPVDTPAPAAAEDPDATIIPGRSAPPPLPPTLATTPPPPAPAADVELPPLDMDFGASSPAPAPEPAPAPVAEAVRLDAPDLMLSENSLNFDLDAPAPAQAPAAAPAPAPAPAAAPAADGGMLEFDIGNFSLDTPSAPAPAPAAVPAAEMPSLEMPGDSGGEDPLATKLALAQEFNAIGDSDGARSLAQEVIAEASGDLKSRAEKFLAEIS